MKFTLTNAIDLMGSAEDTQSATYQNKRGRGICSIPRAAVISGILLTAAFLSPPAALADDLLFDFFNVGPVKNGPWFISTLDHVPVTVFNISPSKDPAGWGVTSIVTYHVGLNPSAPVTITLKDGHFHTLHFPAHNIPGTFDWAATVNTDLPPGGYSVEDSAFTSWSFNDSSICMKSFCGPGNYQGTYGEGFVRVFGKRLTPPPNPQPPMPSSPPSPFPPPCDAVAGSPAQLSVPDCAGLPGSPLTITVLRPLTPATAITEVEFRAPRSGNSCAIRPQTLAAFVVPTTQTSAGSGLVPNATFTATVPAGLCGFTGPGHFSWEVDQVIPGSFLHPELGCYVVQCL